MAYRVLFPDGSEVEASTATGILTAILDGWNPPNVPALKRALAHRCYNLTCKAPDPTLADDDFVLALDALGFLTIDIR